MAEANATLPRNNPSLYIASGAVTLALYRSRQAVKDAIREGCASLGDLGESVQQIAS
jgi:hypothetical protein